MRQESHRSQGGRWTSRAKAMWWTRSRRFLHYWAALLGAVAGRGVGGPEAVGKHLGVAGIGKVCHQQEKKKSQTLGFCCFPLSLLSPQPLQFKLSSGRCSLISCGNVMSSVKYNIYLFNTLTFYSTYPTPFIYAKNVEMERLWTTSWQRPHKSTATFMNMTCAYYLSPPESMAERLILRLWNRYLTHCKTLINDVSVWSLIAIHGLKRK